MHTIDGTIRFSQICAKSPADLKRVLDVMLNSENSTVSSVLTTTFLYFFELMGVRNDDQDSLKVLNTFIL